MPAIRRPVTILLALLALLLPGAPLDPGAARAQDTVTTEPEPLVGTIDWNDVRQEIDGFGGSGAFGQARWLRDKFPPEVHEHILDLLFSTESGAGLSIVRNLVPDLNGFGGIYNFHDNDDQLWLMREAAERGTTRYMGTVWSPPAWMKSNFKKCCGGTVPRYSWPSFADYLAEYVRVYRDRYGVDIYGISMANEPTDATSYDSSIWSANDMRDFIRDFLTPTLALKGVDPKVIMPETSTWGEFHALPTLNDPAAAAGVDIVAAHGYGNEINPKPLTRSRELGKKVWQTEMSRLGISNDPTITDGLEWAKRIHDFMVTAEVNAWNHWWLITEKPDTREALIDLHTSESDPNGAPGTYTVNKRLWTLGNFSRFVRPGWFRVGAKAQGLPITAYKDPATGRFAAVVINDGTAEKSVSLRLNGFDSGSVTPYVTSATEDLARHSDINTASGKIIATLAPRSVTTFVGTGVTTSPLVVSMTDPVAFTGESAGATVTVRNGGELPVSGDIHMVVPEEMEVDPVHASFGPLAPGAAQEVPVQILPPAGTVAGTYPVEARATVGSDNTTQVVGLAILRVYDKTIAFIPNTDGEGPWLFDADGSQLNGAVGDGNARFTDGHSYATYRFTLPEDVTGGTIKVNIGNQFLVRTSTDNATWTQRLVETREIRDLSNRAWRTIDLNEARDGTRAVFVRFEDSFKHDGWGAWLARVRIDLERAGTAS